MRITVRTEWDMGHRLPNHAGACRQLHGHRYAAEVTIAGAPAAEEGAPDEGMVADFGAIKASVRDAVSRLDHAFLVCDRDPLLPRLRGLPGVVAVPFVPTAENIAASLFRALAAAPPCGGPGGITLVRVRLYETPTSWADAAGAE